MLAHARTLTTACNYTEGEIMVCVLDFKREVGLWHSMLASVFNGMHVIFIPYALMKVNPASWMQMVTKHRATVAVCKSRDLHWGLLATKDHRELNLSSLRMLSVADGANPWSLSSCDQFLSVFQVSLSTKERPHLARSFFLKRSLFLVLYEMSFFLSIQKYGRQLENV